MTILTNRHNPAFDFKMILISTVIGDSIRQPLNLEQIQNKNKSDNLACTETIYILYSFSIFKGRNCIGM